MAEPSTSSTSTSSPLSDPFDMAAYESHCHELDASAPRVACQFCSRLVPSTFLTDHIELCPEAVIPCPIGCDQQMTRHQAWREHLSQRGKCSQYIVYCSSRGCERRYVIQKRERRPLTKSALPRHSSPAKPQFLVDLDELRQLRQSNGAAYPLVTIRSAVMNVAFGDVEGARELLVKNHAVLRHHRPNDAAWRQYLKRMQVFDEVDAYEAYEEKERLKRQRAEECSAYPIGTPQREESERVIQRLGLKGCDMHGATISTINRIKVQPAEPSSSSSSPAAASSSSSSCSSLSSEQLESATLVIEPNPDMDAFHSHLIVSRRRHESARFFQEMNRYHIQAIDSIDGDADVDKDGTGSQIRLTSCPHCFLRICLHTDPNYSPSKSIPQPASDSLGSTASFSPSYYYDNYATPDANNRPRHVRAHHELTERLVWSQREMTEHIERCRQMEHDRRQQATEDGADHQLPSVSSIRFQRMLSSSSVDPSLLTGIFAPLRRYPDVELHPLPKKNDPSQKTDSKKIAPMVWTTVVVPDQLPAPADTASTSSLPSSSSPLPPPPLPSLRFSFSHLLRQAFLLRIGLALIGAYTGMGYSVTPEPDHREIATKLFQDGANLSDLTSMYHHTSGDLIYQPLVTTQPRLMNAHHLAMQLSPLQRPLVEPLLNPFMIPDLANIVLDYF